MSAGGRVLASAPGTLEVVNPGPLTLVQDLGRVGWAHIGVGRSGAVDRAALVRANRLVLNDDSAAALEVTLGGLVVRFTAPTTFALTGAPVPATLDGVHVPMATPTRTSRGAELRLGVPATGLRTYLAVGGGIDVPPVLGSRSTDQLAGIGPARVGAGDVLPVGSSRRADVPVGAATGDAGRASEPGLPVELPVLAGPRLDWFAADALTVLTRDPYTVTPASNRVALRLAGTAVARSAATAGRELPSEGLVPGAIQVPPDGQPVLFLADHPVTGGYPVVAVVRAAALDRAAQVRPGEPVRFTPG